jgi:hypothetical protein
MIIKHKPSLVTKCLLLGFMSLNDNATIAEYHMRTRITLT